MYPDLYLMRHGETQWNAEGRLQGRLDSPLTDLGREQAERQALLIRGIKAMRFSSPQGRAIQTAGIVFGAQSFVRDSRLAEIDIGAFSGHRLTDLRSRHPDIFHGERLDWYDRAPGGEGFCDLMHRTRAFLDELRGPALIVTHGMTLNMLRFIAMAGSVDQVADIGTEQGTVHVVRGGEYQLWQEGAGGLPAGLVLSAGSG